MDKKILFLIIGFLAGAFIGSGVVHALWMSHYNSFDTLPGDVKSAIEKCEVDLPRNRSCYPRIYIVKEVDDTFKTYVPVVPEVAQ